MLLWAVIHLSKLHFLFELLFSRLVVFVILQCKYLFEVFRACKWKLVFSVEILCVYRLISQTDQWHPFCGYQWFSAVLLLCCTCWQQMHPLFLQLPAVQIMSKYDSILLCCLILVIKFHFTVFSLGLLSLTTSIPTAHQQLQICTWHGTTVIVWSQYASHRSTWQQHLRSAGSGQLYM